jgi:outer membrane lipoprotein-sorting protein
VKLFRTLSTPRLVGLVAVIVALGAGSAALAMAAIGSGGATPPEQPLAAAIHDALTGSAPDGITADITFTNSLFPSGALTGVTGSALMSGATGRLWATNDGRGRLELQSSAGDVQIVWNSTDVSVYDASSNTVYKAALPASSTPAGGSASSHTPPALSEITSFLAKLSAHATVSGAQPDNVGGQEAYTVSVSPKHDGGLLGSAQLSWDAARGVPLRIAIYAQGSSSPALALEATNISYGAVHSSDVNVAPPAGAKVVDLSPNAAKNPDKSGADKSGADSKGKQVSGVTAVQQAVNFPLSAPDKLVGLPRQDVTLVGSDSALAVYGQGLGAIVVSERKADASAQPGSVLSGLPTVSLNGTSAHELATQLGTVLEWQHNGVAYVLAGSLPPAAAEAAARELK